MCGLIHLLTVGHSDSIHERILWKKKISRPQKNLEEMKKYYVLTLLGYQSIHEKYEPEIFILIAYT